MGLECVQSHFNRGRAFKIGSERVTKSCNGEKKSHVAKAQSVFRALHGVLGWWEGGVMAGEELERPFGSRVPLGSPLWAVGAMLRAKPLWQGTVLNF